MPNFGSIMNSGKTQPGFDKLYLLIRETPTGMEGRLVVDIIEENEAGRFAAQECKDMGKSNLLNGEE